LVLDFFFSGYEILCDKRLGWQLTIELVSFFGDLP
jgi:hypothetical protein